MKKEYAAHVVHESNAVFQGLSLLTVLRWKAMGGSIYRKKTPDKLS
jgi:hypothetical protein